MGIFKKNGPSGNVGGLEEAVGSARGLMSSYGHMGYGSRHAVEVGTEFMAYLYRIHGLGGCGEISSMLEEARKDRPYFCDKLNWFHKEYCSGKLGR
jgi:hypothetical protein